MTDGGFTVLGHDPGPGPAGGPAGENRNGDAGGRPRVMDGEAEGHGAPPKPCPDDFCSSPETRELVRATCEAAGWKEGHRVLVKRDDGTLCTCLCPKIVTFCDQPEVRKAVDTHCHDAYLPPGTTVWVGKPDGTRVACRCGEGPAE